MEEGTTMNIVEPDYKPAMGTKSVTFQPRVFLNQNHPSMDKSALAVIEPDVDDITYTTFAEAAAAGRNYCNVNGIPVDELLIVKEETEITYLKPY